MSYANLNIIINTNAAQAQQSMSDFGAVSKQSLGSVTDDVEKFRQSMMAATAANEEAARRFQSGMTAANDAVINKTKETEQAMESVAKATDKVDTRGFAEKFVNAFGTAFGVSYAATDAWLQKTEELVASKAKAIAIGLAIAAVTALGGVIYAAYQAISSSINFIEGLFTGDSMRSKSIDALIEVNKNVVSLQRDLAISASEANALGDALSRLGVNKPDYVETYKAAAVAMRTNTEELDRLGIKYKDTNGELLTQVQFLRNVRAALEEYKDGYDRSAAAAAIGVGAFERVVETLKVQDLQVLQSKMRLDEYNLGISASTQEMVLRYEQAMRDFDNETQKTTNGFSRAVSDNFMPMATKMAEWFKDGFPTAVNIFRYTLASATSLAWGFYATVSSAIDATAAGIVIAVNLIAAATEVLKKYMKEGAESAVHEWEKFSNSVDKYSESIDKKIQGNLKAAREAMKAAWALDDRDNPLSQARSEAEKKGAGKEWVSPPKPEQPQATVTPPRAPFDRFIEDLERMKTSTEQNEYAMLRLKAAQEAVRQGIDPAKGQQIAEPLIEALQRAQSQKFVDGFQQKLENQNKLYSEQTGILNLNARQQELINVALKYQSEAEVAIIEAKRSNRPLDDQAIASLRESTKLQIERMQALVQSRQELSRTSEFGQNKAFQEYADQIGNQATQVKTAWTNAFKGIEDAFVSFARTGKLNFTDLANTIINDLIRIQIQRSLMGSLNSFMSNYMPNFGGGSSSSVDYRNGSDISSDAASASVPSYAVGTTYVPRDQLAFVHEGEAITPKGANTGINVQIINNTSSQVTTKDDGSGGLQVMINMVKDALAGDVAAGSGNISRAFESRYGLRTAGM